MAFPVAPTNGQTAVVNNITYQFSNVGNTWTRILSTANIITANTLVSNGIISAAGNVSGNYILGNGSQLTGISINPSNIASGTSNVSIVSAGGNATVNIGGTSNVAVFATTGEYVTGIISASGNIISAANITGGNILTGGAISATGTLSVSGNTTVANVSAGSISAGSLSTSGLISATANVIGGNILTAGLISAAGTVTGSSHLGSVISVTANITGGNVLTGGLSISGNVIGNILPAANITYDLGSNTQRWRDLWLSNSTIYLGNSTISANATALVMTNPAGGQTVLTGAGGASQITGAIVSATGNVTGGNVLTAGLVSATGNVTGNYFVGNGSQLTGIASSGGNLWVVGRIATYYVPIVSGTLTVVGRTGNISIAINA